MEPKSASLFPRYLLNGTTFEKKKVTERKMCILIFSNKILFGTFVILRRSERDIIINVLKYHVKWPSLLSDFNETSIC